MNNDNIIHIWDDRMNDFKIISMESKDFYSELLGIAELDIKEQEVEI